MRTTHVKLQTEGLRSTRDRLFYLIYLLALAASVSLWFLAIRSPLWVDETYSYWQISAGFSGILARQIISFPAYSYILWFSTKFIGTSEIALRIPSILAVLGAAYLLYLAARELFESDIAFIAAIVFCIHRIVVFEAIDARPYAFAILAVNAAILVMLRLRRTDSNWLAALFGFLAACIIWFHFTFATILPALILCFFITKFRDRKTMWRQFGIAAAAFALALLPAIPRFLYVLRASGTLVYEQPPTLMNLAGTFAPGWPWVALGVIALVILAVTALVAAVRTRSVSRIHVQGQPILLCLCLALIPILILYGVSVGTSIHTFDFRHCLDAVPGIALCWAMLLGFLRPRILRLLFSVVLVAVVSYSFYNASYSRQHKYSWKHALEVTEKNASVDHAPVLICSDFVESSFATMPVGSAKDSNFFTPLSYYRLSVPVVPLPKALNGETVRVSSQFLKEAASKHERFLAFACLGSYPTIEWLAQSAAATHSVRSVGVFDGIKILEFTPRSIAPGNRPSKVR
jgi:4-amino-4-deoxy-L-arabinose transferase-like glycosyltransferase